MLPLTAVPPDSTWLVEGLLIALFCGSLIGVEREMGKAESVREEAGEHHSAVINPAGIRTHVLVALLGALALAADLTLGQMPLLAAVGLVLTGAATVTTYAIRAAKTSHFGTTSVFTLLTTYVLGCLAQTPLRPMAAAAAVAVTGTLALKIPLHRFVWNLSRVEVAAALKLALVTVVLLPLLPDRTLSPGDWPWLAERLLRLGASPDGLASVFRINLFRLWLLVAVISGLGFCGYVLIRALGPGKGLTLTGLIGGLVSSTAVSVSMAQQSRQDPAVRAPFVAAILAACAVMAVRVLLILVALAPSLFLGLLLPITALLVASTVGAIVCSRQTAPTAAGEVTLRTPFALLPALKLTALIFGVGLLSRIAIRTLGSAGLLATAFLSGIADVDAVTIAVGQDLQDGGVTQQIATAAVLIAVATNTLSKGLMVLSLGSRPVGRATLGWLVVTLLAAGLAFAAQRALL